MYRNVHTRPFGKRKDWKSQEAKSTGPDDKGNCMPVLNSKRHMKAERAKEI
jgi:hypothetical protein